MNRKIPLGAAFAFALLVAAATFSATMIFAQNNFNKTSSDLERSRAMYAKFTDVDRTVRENYVGDINETLLMDSVAQGYIKGLDDKYAVYISAEEFKKSLQTKEGEDVGIGAVLELEGGGYLYVSEVYPDSPAQVAGIEAGDLIVKINDDNLSPELADQALSLIQGEAGTKLSLVVRKGSEDVTLSDLTRRVVAVPSVYSRMIPETDAGYISIRQFNDNTSDQFGRELNKVIEAGAQCLIFDVRDNKGSSLKSAVRIIDKLVPEGLIYSATYKDGTTEAGDTSASTEIAMPMVVLTNAATSSAAELFAQDLKDFGKASTVGMTTMGKGVILQRVRLSDGSAIELTVATLNPASGVTFNEIGVKADYEVQGEGDWTVQDETTDPQLKKALEVVLAMHKAAVTTQNDADAAQTPDSPNEPEPAPESAPPPEASQPALPEPEPEPEPESQSEDESEAEAETDKDESGEPSNEESADTEEDNGLDRDPE